MIKQVFNCKLKGKNIPVEATFINDKIELAFPFFRPLLEEIKAMKGAKWRDELKIWEVDLCKRNLFAFSILQNTGLIKTYDEPLKLIDPDCKPPMWAHQLDIYRFILTRKRCLVGAEPRTGKTRPALQAFLDSEHSTLWFVTTKSAEFGFDREVFKWWGAVRDTYGRLVVKNKIIITMSYDKFTSTIQTMPLGSKLPGFIIFDECHKLKTPTSQRTECAMKLSELLEIQYENKEFVIGLSGTPSPKDPTDWWSQCEVIRSGYIREGTIQKFKVRYGSYTPWDPSTPAWDRFLGWNKEEVAKLSNRLAGLVRIYFQKDCMDLPPWRMETVELTAPKDLLRVAKLITETSGSALEARRRLRQLSDGFEYERAYDPDTNTMKRVGTTFVGSPKIDQLKGDLDEYEEVGRLVIYSGFQGSVDIITKTCLEAGWFVLQIDGRGRFLFNPANGEPKSDSESLQLALGQMDRSTDTGQIVKLAVVAETDAGGTGLEFSASPCIIYYSNSDSGEGRMQSKFRAMSNNMDKVRGLTIKDYILLPSDRLIRDKLEEKIELQAISMGDLKECYANV